MTAVKFDKHDGGPIETGGLLVIDLAKLIATGLLRGGVHVIRQTYNLAREQSHWLS